MKKRKSTKRKSYIPSLEDKAVGRISILNPDGTVSYSVSIYTPLKMDSGPMYDTNTGSSPWEKLCSFGFRAHALAQETIRMMVKTGAIRRMA